MIAALKPYPAMKDSGVPWLGQVPDHWDVQRAKWLFRKMERPVRQDDEVITCFRDGVVTLRKNRRVTGFTESLKEIGYQGIRRGDLVIHAMDAFAGAVGVADANGKGTPVYSVCQPRPDANSSYYAYIVREMARSHWILALATGIRERSTDFRYAAFAAQPVPLPPPTEQASIVRYLDYIDRRVRRYIRAKQKLIGLLEEQKQAIIHHAVTRGLHPDVPLKPSGVEWLGDVPEHWQVVRAKLAFDCVDVRSNTGEEELLTVSSSDGVVPREGRNITMFKAASYVGHKLCWPEDLVINSLWAWANGLGFSDRHGIISTAYGVYRLRKPYRSLWRYLNLALRSGAYQWQFQVRSKGIWKSRLQLTDWSFLDMPLVLPPEAEGNAICEFVQKETGELRQAISSPRREIDLVREYHNRLIADVVTGKLDVRDAAIDDAVEEHAPDDKGVLEDQEDRYTSGGEEDADGA